MQEIQNLYWVKNSNQPKDQTWFLSFQWLQYLILLLNTGLSGWAILQGNLDFYTPKFVSCSKSNNYTETPIDNITDSSVSFDSLTVKLNLICENDHYVVTAKTISFIGLVTGSFSSGFISDNYGRQKAIEWGHLGNALVQIMIYLLPYYAYGSEHSFHMTYWITTLGWFLSINFTYWSSFGAIYCLQDFIPIKYQPNAIALSSAFWCLNYLMLNWCHLFSYTWRTTHLMQICYSLALLVSAYFCIDESIYWLISRKEFSQAHKILKKYQQKTGIKNQENFNFESEILIPNTSTKSEINQEQEQIKIYSSIDLFTNGKEMTLLTIKLCIMWAFTNLGWYGLTINAETLPVGYYTAMTIYGLLDIFCYGISGKIMTKFGRKLPMIVGFFGCAVFLSLDTVVMNLPFVKCALAEGQTIFDNSWLLLSFIFLNLGRCLINILWSLCMKYSEEIYPVPIKVTALGFTLGLANFVCILSPAIIYLQKYYEWLPNMVYIVLALVSGLCSISIMETKNMAALPSFEKAKEFYRKGH